MRWFPLLAAILAAPALAQQPTPGAGPAPGPPRIIGGAGAGCVGGAVELPSAGPGYETVRMSRSTFWGHPATVAGVRLLAARARSAGLPPLYVNDLSLPRGGPMLGVHASHMNGLDADVWLDVGPKPALTLAERDAAEASNLVSADRRGVDPAQWRPAHLTLVRLAAELPGLDRILVNPAIKQQLCRDADGDRGWLRLVRPWYGHSAHMHLHFRCPAGQADCRDSSPPPPGDGCDASLQWWFDQLDLPPRPPAPPAAPPLLPVGCRDILGALDTR